MNIRLVIYCLIFVISIQETEAIHTGNRASPPPAPHVTAPEPSLGFSP